MLREQIIKATNLGYISNPVHFSRPSAMPLFVSAVAVGLPKGCSALDNRMGHRVAVGAGWTREESNFLAAAEAIERYSIQFSDIAPEMVNVFLSSTGIEKPFPSKSIMIGVPDDPCAVTDIGCAAGPSSEFASTKAIFELLEHHHHEKFLHGNEPLVGVKPRDFQFLHLLLDWLDDQLRCLEIRVSLHSEAYCFAICACSDFNESRKTVGHAVGKSVKDAVQSAVFEAVSFWRNMVDLEKNAIPVHETSVKEKEAIRRYRGAEHQPNWPPLYKHGLDETTELSTLALENLLRLASVTMQKDLHLIDLTHHEIGTPVVRCFSA